MKGCGWVAEVFDVVIAGAGPAGLTAALYAGRARLSVVLLERAAPGGLMASTNEIENYPGFKSIAGVDLAMRMLEQAQAYGARLEMAEVTGVQLAGGAGAEGGEGPGGGHTSGGGAGRRERFVVRTNSGDFLARTLIVATGSEPRRLGVPGEDRLRGAGVSYCATCDGAFFQGKDVAVVGGGDSAFQEGLFLTRYARKVYIIHRRDVFRAQATLVERAAAHEAIEFITNAAVEEILGDTRVEGLRLRDLKTGRTWELEASAVFPYIGHTPNSGFLPDSVQRDKEGRVTAGEDLRTTLPGVFAAGDIRPKPLRQVTTAVADGAVAAMAAEHYLSQAGLPRCTV